MSEGGTITNDSPGKTMGLAIADGMKAYGAGIQQAYSGREDGDKFKTSEPPRRR